MKILKKIVVLIAISQIFFIWTSVFADVKTVWWNTSKIDLINRDVTRAESFSYIWKYILSDLPKSYEYIDLKFSDIEKWTKIYDNLQKIVYLDAIENQNIKISPSSEFKALYFYKIIDNILWTQIVTQETSKDLRNRNTQTSDFLIVNSILTQMSQEWEYWYLNVSKEESQKFEILFDVYNTLLENHYNHNNLNNDDMIYSAIKWLAEWTWDKYTTFFPPVEAQDFDESLAWEFDWIGAYIEMPEPGVLTIISPLKDSPAEKAWLKWWDIITKVNGILIDETMDATSASNLIKWKAWTKVNLTIKRDSKEFEVEITRAKITLHDVEYEQKWRDTFYIWIRMFWDKVFDEFKWALEELNKTPWIDKLVIDLRNNPGWYLEQVSSMLSLFVPEGEAVAVVKYEKWDYIHYSEGYNMVDLSKYDVYILGNSWTASASEIMIWTLKDYFPEITFVWEKTYWKWSVQTIRQYYNWSSLKYTVAKWFTWKTVTWIDWVWIKPDIEIKLDQEKYVNWEDNQLDYVLEQ